MAISVQNVPKMGRKMRRPQHSFNLRTKPWQLQPFMIAPVLPMETMKRLLLQSRVVSDPVNNKLTGWWKEYYFFYVKLRDLDGRDDFTELMINYNKDLSSYNSSSQTWTYHYGSAIDWTELCLKRVIEEYFRNEGEAWDVASIDGVPLMQVGDIKWMDSVINGADYSTPDIDLTDVASQDGAAVTASEIENAMRAWDMLRTQNFTEMSFEDYLRTFGVRTQNVEPHRPELIRYVKDWTYPTNTVEPTTGVPSSALSWSIAERADKDRLFKEPGFLLGVSCTRPKVYFGNQSGAAVGLLNDMFSWLPAVLRDDPSTSLKNVAQGAGPLQNGSDSDGYWVDVADIFHYGDQFLNFSLAAADANIIDLPTAALVKRYATATDAAGLFADDDPGTAILIREDGVVSMEIATSLIDNTSSTTAGLIR